MSQSNDGLRTAAVNRWSVENLQMHQITDAKKQKKVSSLKGKKLFLLQEVQRNGSVDVCIQAEVVGCMVSNDTMGVNCTTF